MQPAVWRRRLTAVAMLAAVIGAGLINARHGRSATTLPRAVEFPNAPLPAFMSVGRVGSVGYELVTDGDNPGLYEARLDPAMHSGAITRSALGAEGGVSGSSTDVSAAPSRAAAVHWSTLLVAEPALPQLPGGAAINAMPDSAPLFVAHPGSWPRQDGDLRFATAYGSRPDAVYVHTNAGSVQSFRADDGRRLFSYQPRVIPAGATAQATAATAPRWLGAGLASTDLRLGGAWKTVLASSLGSSAQGVVALDISNPERFTAGNALFEFTDEDDNAMGNLGSAPQFARFRIAPEDGMVRVADMLVFPSGYNAYAGTTHRNTSPRGRLFLLPLDKPVGERWNSHANYFRLTTGDAVTGAANALGPPAMLAGPDGTITMAWAGDLQGNIWRFDFSAPLEWKEKLDGLPSPSLVFVATDPDGLRQPITTKPTLAWAPNGTLVLFGTGKYVEASDVIAAQDRGQSFYALLDDGGVPASASRARFTRADLTQHLASLPANQPGAATVTIAGQAASGGGWVLDFADSRRTGERSIADPVLADGLLAFNTLIPGGDGEAAATRTYLLDPLTGLAADGFAGRRTPTWLSTPRLLREQSRAQDVDGFGAQEVDKVVSVFEPAAPPVSAVPIAVPPTAGTPPAAAVTARSTARVKARAGRLGWREIGNWATLHDAQQP
jgi:type IV pilus assembly protein PilY1